MVVPLIYAAAGFAVFVLLLNRRLTNIADTVLRVLSGIIAFAVLTMGPACLGFVLPTCPWVWVPISVLACIAGGELRMQVIRRRLAGDGPVEEAAGRRSAWCPLTTTDLAVRRYSVQLPRWRGRSFRIVQLTDFHLDDNLLMAYYEDVVARACALCPDLVVLTGDYLGNMRHVAKLERLLAPLYTQETFAVLGNHDYWMRPEELASVFARTGITLLKNDEREIPAGENRLQVAGYDNPWSERGRGMPRIEEGMFRIVLSHTPDNIYTIDREGAHCVFSGHCHGGQFRLPLLGPVVVPSAYGRRFASGHFVVGQTHLFVSNGVGTGDPAFRLYCRPDILVVELCGKSDAGGGER